MVDKELFPSNTEPQFAEDDGIINKTFTEEDWNRSLATQNEKLSLSTTISPTTTVASMDGSVGRIVIDIGTSPPNPEEALLNRSSVLFVAVSFILLMVISLAWLVFYYVQRFRYLHSKERVSRRLAELAKKAVARIPLKTLQPGDRETNPDLDQCAICIEPYRPLDTVRVLPCRHYFHKVCIDPWLLEQRSCPMCKLDILQAYGLRTEIYLTSTSGDTNPTVLPVHIPMLAAGAPAAFVSSTGSDDGMERVALVHSHSRTPTSGVLTHPPLTYVVFTTASTSCLSSWYYVRRPSAEASSSVGADRSDSSESSPNEFIPVLPSYLPDVSLTTTSNSHMVWKRDSYTTVTLDSIHGTAHPLITPTAWPVSMAGMHSSQTLVAGPWRTVTTTSSKASQPEVTFTTQAFRSPVCSIVSQPELTASSTNTDGGQEQENHSTSAGPGSSSSSAIYSVAIPSIDLLYTEPTPPCPVTIPLGNAEVSNNEAVPRSSVAKITTPKSHKPTSKRFNRSNLSNRFSSWWHRLNPTSSNVCSSTVVTVSSEHPTVPSSDHQSASEPLLQPESIVQQPQRPAGTEQVVIAVVENVPFPASTDDDDYDPVSTVGVSTQND